MGKITLSSPWIVPPHDVRAINGQSNFNLKIDPAFQSNFKVAFTKTEAPFIPFNRSPGELSPVKDQGNTQACTSYAISSTIEDMLLLRAPSVTQRVSPLFAHKCHAGLEDGDAWALALALGMLVSKRVALPAEVAGEATKFPSKCGINPGVVRIASWKELADEEEGRNAVRTNPIIAQMVLYESFRSNYKRGEVYRTPSESAVSLHTVEIVGFDGAGWLIKNSWGPGWGDSGFGRVAYGHCGLFQKQFAACSIQVELV